MIAQSVAQRRQVFMDQHPVWPRQTLAWHFSDACARYADRPYAYINGQTYRYRDIQDLASRYAKALLRLGVRRRDHIAVLMGNDATFVPLMVAASMVGAVFIPINAMLTAQELDYVLTQSDSNYLILQPRIRDQDYGQIVSELKTQHRLPQLRQVICLETALEQKVDHTFLSWRTFLDLADGITDGALQERWHASIYADEIAIILYTSGSTGGPKGVMLSSDMLLRCAFGSCLSRAIEPGRITFAPLPFYHCFAIVESILTMTFVGGSFISAAGASPLESLQLMERYRAHDYLCIPSMLVPLVNHPRVQEFDLSALFAMWCGAAPAPLHIWKQAQQVLGLTEIVTGYGQTEVSSSGVITELGDPIEQIAVRVGRPKLGGCSGLPEFGGSAVQYRVIDRDTGTELPAGSVGELSVRGATVTRGYYRKPEETARVLDKDGWLRTGDVGRIDAEGYIHLLGRSTEMYKVSGELVAPREVEIVLSEHPAISQAYVVGVPSALTTEAGAAFVELKTGGLCTRSELIEWCTQRLARFKVPRHVLFMTSGQWPLTGSGKIQKFRLKELAQTRLAHQADTDEPASHASEVSQ